tara:strand:- start:11436 stop:11690 length:255 start_codon:yes stop_codon:yes gene_type:complete
MIHKGLNLFYKFASHNLIACRTDDLSTLDYVTLSQRYSLPMGRKITAVQKIFPIVQRTILGRMSGQKLPQVDYVKDNPILDSHR